MKAGFRYDRRGLRAKVAPNTVIVASAGEGAFRQILLDGRHHFHADEPRTAGGKDSGPGPYELLLMALGSSMSMTLHHYAGENEWPLDQVVVLLSYDRIHAQDYADCDEPTARLHRIEETIELVGPLNEKQRTKLLKVAHGCPVYRTLTSKIEIHTLEGMVPEWVLK